MITNAKNRQTLLYIKDLAMAADNAGYESWRLSKMEIHSIHSESTVKMAINMQAMGTELHSKGVSLELFILYLRDELGEISMTKELEAQNKLEEKRRDDQGT